MAKKRKPILTPEDRARQDALIAELRERVRRGEAEIEERRRARMERRSWLCRLATLGRRRAA